MTEKLGSMMTPNRWLAAIVALGVLDVIMDRAHGVTLSQAARQTFRTNTIEGKVALAACWGGLTLWLIPHLYKYEVRALEAIESFVNTEDHVHG